MRRRSVHPTSRLLTVALLALSAAMPACGSDAIDRDAAPDADVMADANTVIDANDTNDAAVADDAAMGTPDGAACSGTPFSCKQHCLTDVSYPAMCVDGAYTCGSGVRESSCLTMNDPSCPSASLGRDAITAMSCEPADGSMVRCSYGGDNRCPGGWFSCRCDVSLRWMCSCSLGGS